MRPAQSVLDEEDQHCGRRSSNTRPPSAHQSGCLTPPSFHEAPPASRQHPQMPPWVQVPSHGIVLSRLQPRPLGIPTCHSPVLFRSRARFVKVAVSCPSTPQRMAPSWLQRPQVPATVETGSVRKLEAPLSRQHRTLCCLQFAGLGRWTLSSQGFPRQEAEQWP